MTRTRPRTLHLQPLITSSSFTATELASRVMQQNHRLHWSDPNDPANNATLYFRGRRVLDYSLEWLMQHNGLGHATDILFAGGSVGGLATFLRADATHQWLLQRQVPVSRFLAVPISGFFLDHADKSGEHNFGQSMRDTFRLHKCSSGVPTACTSALPPSEHWRCFLANFSYAASRTRFFLLQSVPSTRISSLRSFEWAVGKRAA